MYSWLLTSNLVSQLQYPINQLQRLFQRLSRVVVVAIATWWLIGIPAISNAANLLNPSNPLPGSEQIEQPYTTLSSSNIPSEKVSQFVRTYLKVVDLIERREGELQAAETESESQRIQQEVEAEAFSIIKQAGLTQAEYLQLLGLANTDPEFGERVATQLQEAMD